MYPLAKLFGHFNETTEEDDAVEIRFWVRSERLADDLGARLFAALRAWLATEWQFQGVIWRVTTAETRQIALFEAAGLREYRRFLVTPERAVILYEA